MDKRVHTKEGDRYNHLTCSGNSKPPITKSRGRVYEWICDCGGSIWKKSPNIKNGTIKTCDSESCIYKRKYEKRNYFRIGDRYGYLTVSGNNKRYEMCNGKAQFKCDCGNICYASKSTVMYGGKINCCVLGCPYNRNLKHGCGRAGKPTKEYRSWLALRDRCNNKNNVNYKNYGERGIGVCKEFDSFQAFLDHIGLAPSNKHSIDRINNERGYEIGNVRWATDSEQVNNTRKTLNVLKRRKLLAEDIKLNPKDTAQKRADRFNVSVGTIYFDYQYLIKSLL